MDSHVKNTILAPETQDNNTRQETGSENLPSDLRSNWFLLRKNALGWVERSEPHQMPGETLGARISVPITDMQGQLW
jgi:hypothetical protein